jgi:hypothetical protein
VRGFEIARDRLLIGIVDHEIIRIGSGGRPAAEYPARLPAFRILDLDNFGTKLVSRCGSPRMWFPQLFVMRAKGRATFVNLRNQVLGESLGAGWSRLELREIENLCIIQTMRRYTRCIHRSSLRLNNLDRQDRSLRYPVETALNWIIQCL